LNRQTATVLSRRFLDDFDDKANRRKPSRLIGIPSDCNPRSFGELCGTQQAE
jgi:hypothetical protein